MSFDPSDRHVRVEPVMGTVVSIDVRGRAPSPEVLRSVSAWLHRVDATFSTYRPSSEICRIERGDLARSEASEDVRWVLDRCEALGRVTTGYFDLHATGVLDPSAFVKGWAVQRAADLLVAAGHDDVCVTGGGDVACRGGALPAQAWSIGIQHPIDDDAVAAIAELSGEGIATSGAYARGEHVFDPHTGAAPRGVLSVSVAGPDLGTADALSTAAFAMGLRGPAWTAGLEALGYSAMTILSDHTVRTTAGFPAFEQVVSR